jgi:hypothetical protein
LLNIISFYGVSEINWKKILNGVSIVRLIYLLTILLSIFSFSGCNSTPNTYNKDYSNLKVFAKSILVTNEYQANNIIKQLDSSNNKLQTFIDLKKSYSIPYENNPSNLDNGYWYSSVDIHPFLGNTLFKMSEGSYFERPIKSNAGWYVFYVEKKINQQQFSQLQADQNNKTLERIASYEIDYLKKHENILKSQKEKQESYIQPYNKKENCKVWMGHYGEGTKWFEEDSYKLSWDGGCKDGFASGLGREIETADMRDSWAIAIYKKGKPTYYVEKDTLSNTLFEGVKGAEIDVDYGVYTTIKVKNDDIEITTIAGVSNNKSGISLVAHTSPFWNGSYTFEKRYQSFQYIYYDHSNNDTTTEEFDFFLTNGEAKHGWGIAKPKNGDIKTGEYINNVGSILNLPSSYNNKADVILKEVNAAQQKGFQGQEYSLKVKKQYLKMICKDSVKVTFMDNSEYKAICSNKAELAVMQLVSGKLDKMSQEKIARLENQRFNENQQKEQQHRQEMLAMERARLTEIQRHNSAAEAQANSDSIQRSWKNLNDQLRSMTPKTINVNHSGTIGLYNY